MLELARPEGWRYRPSLTGTTINGIPSACKRRCNPKAVLWWSHSASRRPGGRLREQAFYASWCVAAPVEHLSYFLRAVYAIAASSFLQFDREAPSIQP